MARGGYRPGAGRPKMTEAEKAERAAQRAAGTYVPVKRAKRKPSAKTAKPEKAQKAPKTVAPQEEAPTAEADESAALAAANPLEYMLAVMRNPGVEAARRDRMAIAAAPFMHARREGQAPGKRELGAAAAEKAATKFKPGQAPLKLVGRG